MLSLRLLQDFAAAAFANGPEGAAPADETQSLERLGLAIATAVAHWRDLAADLSLLRPLEPTRAGVIILETVFDEVLDAPRWRALAAAFADACP
ncbi:MAG TPA: hypothetical protein VGN38_05090 [Caulobacteraceae bacterium]|jgi:hypothetical protein|nr:hypothetical protein [Caulobacteraceae bacterium]